MEKNIDDGGSETSGVEEESKKVDHQLLFTVVKDEPEIFLDEDDINFGIDNNIGGATDDDGGGGGGKEGFDTVTKPMEGLHEVGPPPFLKKIFEMVDDSSTDAIISWSCTKISFVVWDPHKLSTDILPKHFKHNNFSSFIRQLNTYRFRKIDSDRWEFANEGFQKGKKHLLKNINRRKQYSQMMPRQGSPQPWVDSNMCGREAEVQKLKNDQNTLKNELLKLKKEQENTESCLANVKERLQYSEAKQKYMVIFMAKAFSNPVLMQRFIEKVRQRKALDAAEISKRRRLAAPSVSEIPVEFMKDTNPIMDSVDGMKNLRVAEEFNKINSEIQTLISSDDSGSPIQEQNVKASFGMDNIETNPDFILWEKLMEDDMIYEGGADGIKHHSDITLELEDLIAKPSDWGVCV